MPVAADNAEIEARVAGDADAKELVLEFKAKKALAKRIIKAVQPALEDAMHKEGELSGRPFEKELRDLDLLLENSMRSRHESIVGAQGGIHGGVETHDPETAGANGISGTMASQATQSAELGPVSKRPRLNNHHLTPDDSHDAVTNGTTNGEYHGNDANGKLTGQGGPNHRGPPTPPLSSSGQPQPLFGGGIPWYMEPFDPDGTTIQEERWTGRDLVRGMSEELSDMDEAELSGLVGNETTDAVLVEHESPEEAEKAAKALARKKAAARRKRNRGW